jgi:L-proline---[L-prolyl-carrier protein] ligase
MAAFLLHQLLTQSAQRHPRRPALVSDGRAVSYASLDGWSSQVARTLLECGVGPGGRVGIYAAKSPAAVAAIYGVLKAGACYVPCDPAAPPARVAAIMADCGMNVVCAGRRQAELVPALLSARAPLRHLVVLGDGPPGGRGTRTRARHPPGARGPGTDLPARHGMDGVSVTAVTATAAGGGGQLPRGTELDLAYILYTSGSTGRPKGVMLTHRNGLSFVEWAAGELGIRPGDRLSSHAPFHFDLSVLDLFAAAAAGASVWLVPPAASVFPAHLARFITESRLTIWYSVPSALSMLAVRGGVAQGDFPSLRAVLFAGEVFPARYLRKLMTLLPHARFANLYGPTETNVCTRYWLPGPPGDDDVIPIGTAIPNVETFLAPGGGADGARAGELCVRGPTVALGYWGDRERTRERFVPGPRGGPAPGVVYRTGDLVRLDGDGNYVFAGRLDSQIKSRGYRIELGEVEAALRRHPRVIDAVAVAVPDPLVTNLIKACVAAQPGTTGDDVRRHCRALLPAYMVPDTIEIGADLPRTSTGKADRQALASRAGPPPATPGSHHDD